MIPNVSVADETYVTQNKDFFSITKKYLFYFTKLHHKRIPFFLSNAINSERIHNFQPKRSLLSRARKEGEGDMSAKIYYLTWKN